MESQHYQRALLSYEHADKCRDLKRDLHLARETRRILLIEERFAVKAVKEAENWVDLLRFDAKKVHLRVEKASLEIRTVWAALEKEGISENMPSNPYDEEFTSDFGPSTPDPVSDDEESNKSGSEASAS
ncbi:hypothetical protein Hypma_009295 [Hypsizygus marmoreus]|uniref:Uncharacterized protein n=1 Tax=Hypsizygus marmoreus TaxID=39966 RepID=A0A369JTE4_HYPMA|nr:hypothetical protein Hypma_009295 [Hypsizygus marmoreus]